MTEDIKNLILLNNGTDGILINQDIDEYISKLAKFSTILPYYTGSVLKGFIAYYCNDDLKENSFLTMILIDKSARGEGIGKLLLECSIIDLLQKGFKNYKLEVLKENERAFNMYQKFGFNIEENRGKLWLLNLNLNNYQLSKNL
jgi:ribosomal protein S18 acetylase RimI-like enzyme